MNEGIGEFHSKNCKYENCLSIVHFCSLSSQIFLVFSVCKVNLTLQITLTLITFLKYSKCQWIYLCGINLVYLIIHKCTTFLCFVCKCMCKPQCFKLYECICIIWENREMVLFFVYNILCKTKDRSAHFEFNSLLQ